MFLFCFAKNGTAMTDAWQISNFFKSFLETRNGICRHLIFVLYFNLDLKLWTMIPFLLKIFWVWHEKLKIMKLDFWGRFVSFLQLLIWNFFHNGSKIYYNPYLLDCYDLKIKTKQAEDTHRRRSIIDLKKIDSVQLFLFTLKCCQKLKELKVENVRVKNIYFWGHTLTNF